MYARQGQRTVFRTQISPFIVCLLGQFKHHFLKTITTLQINWVTANDTPPAQFRPILLSTTYKITNYPQPLCFETVFHCIPVCCVAGANLELTLNLNTLASASLEQGLKMCATIHSKTFKFLKCKSKVCQNITI